MNKLEDRFWSKVEKKHWKQCWPWIAGTDSDGYGSFWFEGSAVMSHRIALFLKTGLLPPEMQACHTCDNPICNNPHHLFWGSQSDNMQDMVRKGRHGSNKKVEKMSATSKRSMIDNQNANLKDLLKNDDLPVDGGILIVLLKIHERLGDILVRMED